MKIFTFLVILVSMGLAYGKEASKEEKRSLIAYETKIFHKIPDQTIHEEKASAGLKTSVSLDEGKSEKEDEAEGEKSSLPSYEFGYGVKDPISGDHKDQWEKRHGDHVKGGYRFDESDGTQRVVEYKADGKRGFEATVKNVQRTEDVVPEAAEESGGLKEGKLAHSYSYLKRTGH